MVLCCMCELTFTTRSAFYLSRYAQNCNSELMCSHEWNRRYGQTNPFLLTRVGRSVLLVVVDHGSSHGGRVSGVLLVRQGGRLLFQLPLHLCARNGVRRREASVASRLRLSSPRNKIAPTSSRTSVVRLTTLYRNT